MLSLTIHHNIHLTKEQRYALHEGKEVSLIGLSVPVWYANKMTSEPAKEIFCRYYLKNPKKDIPIQILEDGYEISIPYREGTKLEISDEEWRFLNQHDPDKLEAMYKKQIQEVSSRNLLDVKDGGNGGTMSYREHNKIKKGEGFLSIMHFVSIDTMEKLLESISTI
jgi:hypothetical protein